MSAVPAAATTDDGRRTLAPFGRRRVELVARESLGAYHVLRVSDPDGPPPRPGQFFMLAAVEGWGAGDGERPFLARAFSVMRARPAGTLQFVLEDVGPGTHRLAALGPGDALRVTGPLGLGFAAPREGRRPLLVGGGIGIAPLAIWQDELGPEAVALLGFRGSAHAHAAELLHGARVATDDGSVGHHGLVTDLLESELDRDRHATVYACGPPAMLEAVRRSCVERAVPGQLALETPMACGFGACFGCVVPTHNGYARVCVDGPVLDVHEVTTALVAGSGH